MEIGLISFPRDEGRHKYLVEWWYGNFHVTGQSSGKKYGVMVAYFNNGFRLACITDETRGKYHSFINHGFTLVSDKKLSLYHFRKKGLDRWYNTGKEFNYHWKAALDNNRVDFLMEAVKPPIALGGTGKVKVGTGGESYYYTQPRFNVTGRLKLTLTGEEEVQGLGWLDHQYGNFGPVIGSQGYEWFSIQLDNGVDIICYNIWEKGKVLTPLCCWSDEQGRNTCVSDFELTPLDFWTDDKGRKYARRWRVRYPVSGPAVFDLVVQTTMDNQKINFLLYEGTTRIEPGSTFQGKQVQGVGYAELTHKAALRMGYKIKI